jgi:4-amino-4-deoxy-L-arabinose transferase-like glycosyltransferase
MITARRTGVTALYIHTFLAMLTGLALRLLFALQFPAPAGDSGLYLQLARLWADHHIYGLLLNGQLVPTDLRMPGYPAFLAGVATLFGRSNLAIVLSQAVLDLCTCLLTAALAAAMAPSTVRRRVAIAALWLTATCPFLANYSAAVLTEVLTAFLTTLALACLVSGMKQQATTFSLAGHPLSVTPMTATYLGAFITGVASLVRPEMPLLLIVAGGVFALRWWRSFGLRKVLLTGMAMAVVFLLPLIPWVARNLITMHKFQISADRYTTIPGEYAPVGYYKWQNSWMVRFRDVYISVWKLNEEPVLIDDFPASAFDSTEEKQHVAELFDQYNKSPTLDISPEVDQGFAEIARERTARHPLRTYVTAPFGRALTLWFTPRTELLPIDGKFFPVSGSWEDSHASFLTTALFGALGYLYPALALAGIWAARRYARSGSLKSRAFDSQMPRLQLEDSPNLWGISLIVAYILVRTAFLTTVEAPEPRYVITCYPAVLALAGLVWIGRPVGALEALQNVAEPGRAGKP